MKVTSSTSFVLKKPQQQQEQQLQNWNELDNILHSGFLYYW
jgi:hypothetical protein